MLGGNDNGVHTNRLVPVIFHSHLCLAVRTEIGQCLILPEFCQLLAKLMGQRNCQRHQFRCFVAGIAKHHALISGTRFGRFAASGFDSIVNAHSNIRRLLVDRLQNGAGVAVKTVLGSVVADVYDHVPCDLLNVHLGSGGDFAHAEHHASFHNGFTRYASLAVLFQNCVQHCVRNLVADLIRMSFCHGF